MVRSEARLTHPGRRQRAIAIDLPLQLIEHAFRLDCLRLRRRNDQTLEREVTAEIQANNIKVQELADEQGLKVARNVAAGVFGLVVWPVWFAMDAKGAATKEVAALQARQQYLTTLATEKCAPKQEPEPKRGRCKNVAATSSE